MEALDLAPPGTARLTPSTLTSDNDRVVLVSISPLELVHLLIVFPFLAPTKSRHLIVVQVDYLGNTWRFGTFLEWLWLCKFSPIKTTHFLSSVNLMDDMLQQHRYIHSHVVLVLSPSPAYTQPAFQYMSNPTKPYHPPVPLNPLVVPAELWVDDIRSLLWIFNVTIEEELPDIWHTVAPLSKKNPEWWWGHCVAIGLT